MDENQNLENPLIINQDIEKDPEVKAESTRYFFTELDEIDMQTLLEAKKNLNYELLALLEPYGKSGIKDKKKEITQTFNPGMTTRTQQEENIVLSDLYEQILMSKVFEKFFLYVEATDFQTGKVIESEENGSKTQIYRILFKNKQKNSLHLISFIQENERRTEYKIYTQLSNIVFEYFEFTSFKNLMIAGHKGFIMLWDIEQDVYLDGFKIPFLSAVDVDDARNAGNIQNYKSKNSGDITDIYYTVGQFVFNLKILVDSQENPRLLVSSSYCKIDKEPRFFYLNTEEMIIAMVTSDKDASSQQESLGSIFIIDPNNMTVSGQSALQKNCFDDIYFKVIGSPSLMNLKVIRKLNNTLFVTNVSIINIEGEKSQLSVTFDSEAAIAPEFFLKYNVLNIENSVLNCLMVAYTTKELHKIHIRSLFDYTLNLEVKNIHYYRDGDFYETDEFRQVGPSFIDDKLMFKAEELDLKIYSLSEFKIIPKLKCYMFITKINFVSPFLFIEYGGSQIECHKVLLNSKGAISPELTIKEIENIDENFPEDQKKKIITTLCKAKDPLNLKIYLDWKINNLTPENFEQIPVKLTLDEKNLSCTELLLQYILQISDDFPKIKSIYEEIESCFGEILLSTTPSVPLLLDKLFSIKLEYGSPKSNYLPLYQAYDFRGSSIKGYFFGRSTADDKDYQVKNSLVRVPDVLGSSNSLKLTKSLCETEDMRIFGTEFIRTYIRSKWVSLQYSILGLTLLMWFNIVLVTFLVIKDPNPLYLYVFVIVNTLLLSTELIQIANLGVESYIGIYKIHYFSLLQLLVSCCIVFVYADFYIYGLFVLVQTLSVNAMIGVSGCNRLVIVGFFSLPSLGLMVIYFFTSEPLYFFIIVGILEFLIYIGSYFGTVLLIGLRFGLQCMSVALFVCYPSANLYLYLLNLTLLACETVYFFIKRNSDPDLKTERFYNYLSLLAANLLVTLSFVTENMVYGYLSLCLLVVYDIYRFKLIQYYDEVEKRLRSLDIFTFRFCVYLLAGFILTNNKPFLYCFLACNLVEYCLQRELAVQAIFDDTVQLVFNKNTVDIIRYIISVVWVIMFNLTENSSLNQQDSLKLDMYLTWFFVFLNLINALLGFRAFDQTRFFIRLIFRCVVDIVPFLIIFLYFTVSFGLLNVVQTSSLDFETFWKNPFDQSVSGFTHNPDESILEYFMFTLGTLLIVIIMLNLLISILGNIFENFLNEAKLIDFKVMIETIYEVEVLIFWRRSQHSTMYFASCDHLVLGDQEENQLEEKIDAIIGQVKDNQNELNSRLERIEKMLQSRT